MIFGGIEELRRTIATRIEQAIPQVEVAWENPFVRRATPFKRPVVGVSIDKVQTGRLGLSDFLGDREAGDGFPPGQQFGRGITLGLRLDIYDRHDSGRCHALFAHLCQVLMLEGFSPALESLSCGEVSFDRTAGAFHLVCKGELKGCLSLSHPAVPLAHFEIRRVT